MTPRRIVQGLLVVVAIVSWWSARPRGEAIPAGEPPIDWSADPVQTPTARVPFEVRTRRGPATLTPRAAYDISAVVAASERYRFDDPALLSPLDLLLTWGELPTAHYREKLRYSQSWRFYFWRTEDLALDARYVTHHAANTHLIPSTRNVKRALLAIDRGDEVRLRGLLVDASAPGFRWPTSLERGDHGDSGCEILYVESVELGDRRYR